MNLEQAITQLEQAIIKRTRAEVEVEAAKRAVWIAAGPKTIEIARPANETRRAKA